jgi:hypothetical protein
VWRLTQLAVDLYAERTHARRWLVTRTGQPTLF